MSMDQENSVGIVLAGGGAKGAYHTGFFRGLHELGLWDRVTVISGTSIGAFNTMLAMHHSYLGFQQGWDSITLHKLCQPRDPSLSRTPQDFYPLDPDVYRGMTLEEYLSAAAQTPFTTDVFRAFLEELMPPEEAFGLGKPRAFVCAYNMDSMEPEYFCLNDHTPAQRAAFILASCAIPVIFPPVRLGEALYCDGGIVPPFRDLDNSDIAPVAPLQAAPPAVTLVVHLSAGSKADVDCLPPGRCIELYPSQPLEESPGSGSMDFSPASRNKREQLGYQDHRSCLQRLAEGKL